MGLGYGTSLSYREWEANDFSLLPSTDAWFAGYVDVTSIPLYAFENLGGTPGEDVILSFIVADGKNPCQPTWGNYYTLDEANGALDLDRRIARLQQQGGRIAISFGGALNSELGLACTDEDALYTAYKTVIDRYQVSTIDLDLERESLSNAEARERRARVIARLQADYRAADNALAIWLTLPVAPSGLTEDGTNAVTAMLAAGVDLAGVNVMTMEYGGSKDPNDSMYEAARKALIETHRQLGILYRNAGLDLFSSTLWKKIGATPMIGQNGFVDEVFTIEDAAALNQFALDRGIGRMSLWSANRDVPCGTNYVDTRIVSDVCSGVRTPAGEFTRVLASGFVGDLDQSALLITENEEARTEHIVDDPTTSPYPVWQQGGVYLKGTKVVWRGNVYEAKWWTKGDQPDNPILNSWELPWQLIGPVLPGEQPIPQPTLPAGTYPQWNGGTVYEGGERVLFEGVPYQAKWWNQGDSPALASVDPDSSPWIPLSQTQIIEILKRAGIDNEFTVDTTID
jgi:chitinase